MNKTHIIKTLAWAVIAVSVLVIIGWLFNIEILKSISPTWVTMKFTTALSFLFSGIILLYMPEAVERKLGAYQIVSPLLGIIVLFIMGILLFSVILGVRSGLEDLFVQEATGAVKTTTPGQPSVGTMLNFVLIGIAGLLVFVQAKQFARIVHLAGWVISVVGMVALLGYIIDMPALYYTVEGFSSAMALHTALLFIIIGAGFIMAGAASGNDQT